MKQDHALAIPSISRIPWEEGTGVSQASGPLDPSGVEEPSPPDTQADRADEPPARRRARRRTHAHFRQPADTTETAAGLQPDRAG